ncbi:MAG: helix-turn-helix transcriptional regulator [Bifidobacterium psychraerophilum]|uniref:hypothetical protein n=1 Tax=Bifidobacterium psychraerophilum TaxID=218140 RepID=UPI0039E89F16
MQTTQQLLAAGIRYRLAIMDKSQRWLAEQVGISKYALARRMHSKTTFDVDLVDRLASALGTDFSGLIALPADAFNKVA